MRHHFLKLAAVAALIPPVVMLVLPTLLHGASLGQVLGEEPAIVAINMAISASAFVIFALIAPKKSSFRRAGNIGLAVTVLLWGLLIIDASVRSSGGANIGLGILLLTSPVLVGGLIALLGTVLPGGTSDAAGTGG